MPGQARQDTIAPKNALFAPKKCAAKVNLFVEQFSLVF